MVKVSKLLLVKAIHHSYADYYCTYYDILSSRVQLRMKLGNLHEDLLNIITFITDAINTIDSQSKIVITSLMVFRDEMP